MAKVFISYSSKDTYFVSLLQALLQFHYIDVWWSVYDIKPGTQFPPEIEQAIKDANTLLVVASAQAVKSKWMTKEISAFQAQNKDGLIVPLLLDAIDLDAISPGLSNYQAIDFSQSMLEGCQHLFQLFGKEFLSYRDRRNQPTGRRSVERRTEDRRKSPLIKRLRKGFWLAYTRATGRGEFEELPDTLREQFKVIDSLREEVQKYQYSDESGKIYDPTMVLEESIRRVWDMMSPRGKFKAVYIVEGIAEELYENYKIITVANRRSSSRRLQADRRDRRKK
jgi:hypothetical protein